MQQFHRLDPVEVQALAGAYKAVVQSQLGALDDVLTFVTEVVTGSVTQERTWAVREHLESQLKDLRWRLSDAERTYARVQGGE